MSEYEKLFDDIYKTYDKVRPDYPLELFEDIIAYKPINKTSRVMEIGIGTGKATQFFVDLGCQIASVEPGPKMAKFVREKYKDYEEFSCYNFTFEKYMGINNTFDLIYSATALHWIDEKTAYEKSFRLLKRGGVLARFAYHACRDDNNRELYNAIDNLYEKYMDSDKQYTPYNEEKIIQVSVLAEKYGFIDNQYKVYHFSKDFTAEEYVDLLSTYPDHMKIEESQRKQFFNEIKKTITAAGNNITVNYIVDLHLSKKP